MAKRLDDPDDRRCREDRRPENRQPQDHPLELHPGARRYYDEQAST
jgi:hypothetical protein